MLELLRELGDCLMLSLALNDLAFKTILVFFPLPG